MQISRFRLTIRDLVLIIALAVSSLSPTIGLVSAQDPTMQATHPTSQPAGSAAQKGCGAPAGQSTGPARTTHPLGRSGLVFD